MIHYKVVCITCGECFLYFVDEEFATLPPPWMDSHALMFCCNRTLIVTLSVRKTILFGVKPILSCGSKLFVIFRLQHHHEEGSVV